MAAIYDEEKRVSGRQTEEGPCYGADRPADSRRTGSPVTRKGADQNAQNRQQIQHGSAGEQAGGCQMKFYQVPDLGADRIGRLAYHLVGPGQAAMTADPPWFATTASPFSVRGDAC